MRTPSSFETRDTLLDSFQRERSGYDDGDVVRESRHAADSALLIIVARGSTVGLLLTLSTNS